MATKQAQNVSIRFDESSLYNTFLSSTYANKFNIIEEEEVFCINVAAMIGNQLVASNRIILGKSMLKLQTEVTLQYYEKVLEEANLKPENETAIVLADPPVSYGNFMHFSRHETAADLSLYYVRINSLMRSQKEMDAAPVLAINLPLATQLGILKRLFIK